MTTGQRIAAKRKELKLSQEALGEQLGVSRQSIYKWESDTSLPEIDKLVAMSRLFCVSVGWLLGVEEERTEESPAPDSCELTEQQLNMVEEIVARYIAAQPKPKKQKKWPLAVVLFLLCCVGVNLFQRLDRLDNRYNNLQNSIGNISSNVDNQINSITNRLEKVLLSQNNLTADYDTQYISADLAANTITFRLHATPKTYVPGMRIIFQADCGTGEMVEVTAQEEIRNKFTAQLTCPLTDDITLSAILVNGDTRQIQVLDYYSGLYEASLPSLQLGGYSGATLTSIDQDGKFPLRSDYCWTHRSSTETKFGQVEIQSVQVGLFVNFQLHTWLEPCEEPERFKALDYPELFFHLPETTLELEPLDTVVFAAIYTDQYGRKGVAPVIPVHERIGAELTWTQFSDATPYYQIENYKF